MRAEVTNLSRAARGFELEGGTTRFLEPGETAVLELADHPLHHAWEAAGDVAIVLAAEPEAAPTERPGRRIAAPKRGA